MVRVDMSPQIVVHFLIARLSVTTRVLHGVHEGAHNSDRALYTYTLTVLLLGTLNAGTPAPIISMSPEFMHSTLCILTCIRRPVAIPYVVVTNWWAPDVAAVHRFVANGDRQDQGCPPGSAGDHLHQQVGCLVGAHGDVWGGHRLARLDRHRPRGSQEDRCDTPVSPHIPHPSL